MAGVASKAPSLEEAIKKVHAPQQNSADEHEDVAKSLGQGLIDGILVRTQQQMLNNIGSAEGSKGNANIMDMMKEFAMMKMLMKMIGESETKAERSDPVMAQILKAIIESNTATAKTMMEMQNKGEDRMSHMLAEMRTEFKELVKDKTGKDGGDLKDFMASIGVQTLQARANSDPVKSLLEQRQQLKDAGLIRDEGDEHAQSTQDWVERQRIQIEKDKIEREDRRQEEQEKREEKAQERREKMMADLFAALAGSKGALTSDAQGGQGQLYRYECSECGALFALMEKRKQVVCPQCKADLTANWPDEKQAPIADTPSSGGDSARDGDGLDAMPDIDIAEAGSLFAGGGL